MKILHLADLHIGKKLEGKSRYDDQVAVLDEIYGIAEAECVDIVLIAGDVFDTSLPKPEARTLFYKFAMRCSQLAPVVAIAGNHDGAEDLTAPRELAELSNIKLVGSAEMLAYDICGERVNIFALPYLCDSNMKSIINGEESFEERVSKYISDKMQFVDGQNNIMLAHLFISGNEESGDEVSLGPARMLSKNILPDNCYVALGHIHKPSVSSRSKNAYYAGSPLNYHFGSDRDNDKSVIIASMSGGVVTEVRRLPLMAGSRLCSYNADSFEQCIEVLSSNPNSLIRLVYSCHTPLTAMQTKQLRSHKNLVKIEVNLLRTEQVREFSVKSLTATELFKAYCIQCNKGEPSDTLLSCFSRVMEKIEGGER